MIRLFDHYLHRRTPVQSLARATVGVVVGVPLAWLIFGMLSVSAPGRELIQLAAMAVVSGVFVQRVYFANSKLQSLIRTRILIYGVGPSAQLVAQTLVRSGPHTEVVGFVMGPNEDAGGGVVARDPEGRPAVEPAGARLARRRDRRRAHRAPRAGARAPLSGLNPRWPGQLTMCRCQ
jgi:hypothetical protein